MQQRNTPEHQKRVTNKFYDTAVGVDDRFKPKYRQHTRPSIDIRVPTSIDRRPEFGKRAYDRAGIRRFHWQQNDEYGVYRDDHEHARGVDGHIIHVSKDDIRNLLERASMDEHNYICLPEHARSFTDQAGTKQVTSTRVRSTRNPTAKTTSPITAGVMETILTRSYHHRLKRARLKQCLIGFLKDSRT